MDKTYQVLVHSDRTSILASGLDIILTYPTINDFLIIDKV